MKKILSIIGAVVLSATVASAQNDVLGALKQAAGAAASSAINSAASSAAGSQAADVLTSILGSVITEAVGVSLNGTWTYAGVASAIQTENTLSTIAASAYKETLESKLDSYLAKVGIKEGSAQFIFGEDGTFSITNGKKAIAGGNYTLEGNVVSMKFGKVYNYMSMTGTVAVSTSGYQILFEADKFVAFLGKTAKILKKKKASTSTLSSIVSQVTGLKLGYDLKK